jgi:hypothetical protein
VLGGGQSRGLTDVSEAERQRWPPATQPHPASQCGAA